MNVPEKFVIDIKEKRSELNSWFSRLKSLLAKIYTLSPINFSSLTGYRYPEIPRLKGYPILGRICGVKS